MRWSSTPSGSARGAGGARPDAAAGGVVVRVAATGMCRSDWHGWQGHDPDIVLPHVPGHELAGMVAAVGRRRARLGGRRPGDRAVRLRLRPLRRSARAGDQQVCERQTSPASPTGARSPSTSRSTPPTSTWSPSRTSSTSPPPPRSAAGSPRRSAPSCRSAACGPGEWVAVHGCGGVGLSAVQIAAAAGARVVAVDVAPDALELARDARRRARASTAARRRARPRSRELTGGGAHVSLDALGARGHLRELDPEPAAARPARPGRAAAAGAGPARGADGPGDRPGAARCSAATAWPRTPTRSCSG